MKRTPKFKRMKRALKTRSKIRENGSIRLTIHRTRRHTYANIIQNGELFSDAKSDLILASVSTTAKEYRDSHKDSPVGNVEEAKIIGQMIAEKAKDLGITKVAFDRSGFNYHGRVKALADSAREHGLII